MSKSKMKTMLICFFHIRGIIQFESVPKGTTVKQTFYVEVLQRLFDAEAQVRRAVKRSLVHSSLSQHTSTFFGSSVMVFRRKRHLCHGSYAILP
jgi:hypothetical protein